MSFSLRSSSDRDILSRLQELARRERSLTLSVLLHLNEIERRRLHLKQGYASMFDYCTNALGYSASAAGRRIQTARCVERFPEVYALLEANEVNLTTISEVSRVLTAARKDDLLARIRGKSQREVKAIVAEYDPRAAIPRDQVRLVVLRTPGRPSADAQPGTDAVTAAAAVAASPEPAPSSPEACEKSAYSRSGSASHSSADVPASAATFAVLHVIKFAASGAFMQKLGKIKSLASHRLPPNPSFEQVFELAMDCFLGKEDPEARQERRQKRRERTTVAPREISTGPAKAKAPAPGGKSDGRSRYVAAAVRDRVSTRDEGRCTFTGPDGRRCASRHALQVDHIKPVARGGTSTSGNLRLLCAHHNRLEAERLMGPWSRQRERGVPANSP